MSIRSKAYKVTLPAAQYSEEDARKLGDWSQDNCSRAIVVRDNDALTWIAIRERIRTLGESLRHVRGVFHALQLDSKPLLGEHWLALCVEQEALEALAEMEEKERSAAREDTIDEPASAGARHVLLPSSRRRGAGRSRPPTTTFEVERSD